MKGSWQVMGFETEECEGILASETQQPKNRTGSSPRAAIDARMVPGRFLSRCRWPARSRSARRTVRPVRRLAFPKAGRYARLAQFRRGLRFTDSFRTGVVSFARP